MRAFVAIKITSDQRMAVGDLIGDLKTSSADVKWVKPENLHLTLKFLGNMDESRVGDVAEAVRGACQGITPFEISLRGTGAYPSVRRPRVVWVGIENGRDSLLSLNENIENRLETVGFQKEKRSFSPHLTIGRLRRNGRPGNLSDRLGVHFDGGECVIDRVLLMKSTLTPEGPIYEELGETVLGA